MAVSGPVVIYPFAEYEWGGVGGRGNRENSCWHLLRPSNFRQVARVVEAEEECIPYPTASRIGKGGVEVDEEYRAV